MDKLVTLKHWQIFLVVFTMPFIFYCILSSASNPQDRSKVAAFSPLLGLIVVGLLLTWFYSMADNLQKKQIESGLPELKNFKTALYIYLAYMAFTLLLMLEVITVDYSQWKLTLDLISQGSYLYMVWFISKSLKTIELKREALFSEYILTLLLLWMFPIGIWFIQPRINEVCLTKEAQQ